MSIKQNFPTIDSSLNLDFAGSRVVDSRITFTRASAATVTDAQGVLQTVRDNKPRIDFDGNTGECRGLLIEEQRTNLIVYSNDPDYSSWTLSGASIAKNVAIAPDGTMSADKIVENTGSSTHGHYQTLSVSNSTLYTWSAYFKSAERTSVMVYAQSSRTPTAIYNLSTGTVSLTTDSDTTAAATITPAGNGWYRCTITATTVGTTAYFNIAMVVSGNQGYTGNGSSGLFVWGAQVEAGTFATSYIPSITTFTSRASSATYFDATGVLRTAPVNGARYGFGYDSTTQKWVSQGLILEAAATNLFPTSLMSAFAAVQNMDIVSTSIAAIDGTVGNVFKLTPTTANTSMHSIFRNLASSTPSTRCVSVYLKAAGYNYARIYCDGTDPTTGGVIYDLSTGTTSIHSSYAGANRVAYGMENVGNGWYRCWVSGTATNADWYYHIDVADTAAFGSFAGNGSSGVYAWGPQMEIGSVPTSYISTSGSTVTRAADVSTSAATTRSRDSAALIGTNFTSWWKNTEQTYYAEAAQFPATEYGRLIDISDGATQRYSMYRQSGVGTNGINSQLQTTGDSWSTNTFAKFAVSFSSTGISSGFNGTLRTTAGTFTPFTADRMNIGQQSDAFGVWNGHIKKIVYYPKRLSNTQLQALTV